MFDVPFTANARALGSRQTEAFKAHSHQLSSRSIQIGSGGLIDVANALGTGGWGLTTTVGGTETRPMNVAFHSRIHV